MKNLLTSFILLLVLIAASTLAQDGHEYSPLVEKTVNYENWTLNNLRDNKPIDLRSLVHG